MSHPRENLVVMSADESLAQLASRQYGLAAVAQAYALGFTREMIRHRLNKGGLVRVTHRVVSMPGAVRDPRRLLLAATLDAGPGTVVSRLSGAALWRLPGFQFGRVDLARLRGVSGRAPAIGRLYPVRYLPSHLATTVRGVPVVSLPYLVFQLAGILNPLRTERVFETVASRSPGALVTMHNLLPELAEHGRNGIVVMRDLLEKNPPGSHIVASGLEKRFERILAEAGEKPLRRQVDAGGHEWEGRVDYVDDEIAVIFEVDSETYHLGRLASQEDAERDERMRSIGYNEVVRIPEEWIWHDKARAVQAVRDARRRWGRTSRRHAFDT